MKTIKKKKKVEHVQLLQNLKEYVRVEMDLSTEAAHLAEELDSVIMETPERCVEIYLNEEETTTF